MADYPAVNGLTYSAGPAQVVADMALDAPAINKNEYLSATRRLVPLAKRMLPALLYGGGGAGLAPSPRPTSGQLWPRA